MDQRTEVIPSSARPPPECGHFRGGQTQPTSGLPTAGKMPVPLGRATERFDCKTNCLAGINCFGHNTVRNVNIDSTKIEKCDQKSRGAVGGRRPHGFPIVGGALRSNKIVVTCLTIGVLCGVLSG